MTNAELYGLVKRRVIKAQRKFDARSDLVTSRMLPKAVSS